ncbi:MAG: exonuclease SbcCD subunit D C-terminal domain-containing protein [Lachnospiraceae bacterium]|nr:exonuclease SbcCD subunit D C-terminal domain-containing protein [Lachnospiraceae bacterium]
MEYSMYYCPECGKKYKVKGEGRSITCKSCTGVYLIKKSLTFVHISDLHLGKNLCDMDLIDDQRYILMQIIGIIKNKAVDGVFISGDIYDRAVPSEAATELLNEFLEELSKLKINIFIISGNHDSDERLNYGSRLFESSHIYISAKYRGKLFKYTMNDGDGEVDIYMLPFIKASTVKNMFPDADISSYNDALRVVIENEHIDPQRRNILLAHQFVAGKGKDPRISGSESVATQCVGTVEKVGYDLFDAFDYVALGHIHSPQSVGREEIRYSGSPLKYSLSEVNDNKSVPIITMGPKGNTEIELVALKPLRNLRHLKGNMSDLLRNDNIVFPNDYIYITLTDEDIQNDAMHICRQRYPYTVKVDYENSHTKQIENADIDIKIRNKSFDEVIRDFYSAMYGSDISDDEMKVMMETAKEAGVINEAG